MKHKWTEVAKSANGETCYIDFESIEERDGHVYFWTLQDYVTRQSAGEMSSKSYNQVDCDSLRWKMINFLSFSEPMGEGGVDSSDNIPSENWSYLSPNTAGEITLKVVCNYVKLSEEDRQKLLQSLKKNKE
jgi:hypothetical protein